MARNHGRREGWPATDEEREELLREVEASGLTIRRCAEELGISAQTLYSWRRRLRQRARFTLDEGMEFMELKLRDASGPSGGDRPLAEVVFDGGITIRVARGFCCA